MNPRIKELAEDAGFCFWEDEEWKPHGAIIDWSADYDKEFQKYTELLINEFLSILGSGDIDFVHWKLMKLLETDND